MAGNITVKEDIDKLLDVNMSENEKKSLKKKSSQVSCYLSVAQKISLELEVVYFKNNDTEDAKKRNTINKYLIFLNNL
jgi:Na+-transporting NADH:ubiquinone oxidoreductase subunit NqrF